jgi:hypothetical protein
MSMNVEGEGQLTENEKAILESHIKAIAETMDRLNLRAVELPPEHQNKDGAQITLLRRK